MKKHQVLGFIVLASTLISACSNRALYETAQHNRRTACLKQPPPQAEKCLESVSKPYEEYERERQALLKEAKNKK
ncbi:MAG: hypothetical protein GW836_03870 [Paraglaciecola sp.]|nr:hypothetical protein [Paraglaciecola sp.]